MDDYDIMEKAQLDPQSLWRDKDHLIIDEAQRLPGLFNAIKVAVDTDKKKHPLRATVSSKKTLPLVFFC
jgi:predicted AAA+ superfamily ATPase